MTSRHSVTIELDDFGWERLRREAQRQSIPLERLLEHAAMYYLADLHSGRAAVQVFRRAIADREPGTGRRFTPAEEEPMGSWRSLDEERDESDSRRERE
jgi:hypothetical protein